MLEFAVSPLDKLLAWLWDPSGVKRQQQSERRQRTQQTLERNREAQDRAIYQVRRTQQVVRDGQKGGA